MATTIQSSVGGACSACGGRGEVCIGNWWGKPVGTRPMVKPRRRWEDNIKAHPQEVGCGGKDWIELAQDTER
jgi:hypothetical protein